MSFNKTAIAGCLFAVGLGTLMLAAYSSRNSANTNRPVNVLQQVSSHDPFEVAIPQEPALAQSRGGVQAPPDVGIPVPPTETPAPTAEPPDTPLQPMVVFKNHIVLAGENLSIIAARTGVPVATIMQMNAITNPDRLLVGQVLRIGATVQVGRAPGDNLVPDSEAVYSPAYQEFDVNAFARKHDGYLMRYQETVEGISLTGPQIVQLVAERFSVGPRLLLTVLEIQGGWVTGNPRNVTEVYYPMGYVNSRWVGLYRQLFFAADKLNEGYYAKMYKGLDTLTLVDGTRLKFSNHVNAGTLALQDLFAYEAGYSGWKRLIGEKGFVATYRKLFGDPFVHAIEPLVPPNLKQPEFRLPFQDGHTWFFVGGPHGGWADGSAWAAVDLAPLSGHGTCLPSGEWTVAVAPGRIVSSEKGRVIENLQGKHFQGTGWSVMYMHMASLGRIAAGAQVRTGDDIGHPSCEGGAAQADHLHIARLYNGQWIAAADRRQPLVMAGWQVVGAPSQYDGSLIRGSDDIAACNCTDASVNGIVAGAPQTETLR